MLQLNSLYGFNMTQPQPIGPLEEIIDPEVINSLDWKSMTYDQEYGYLLSVDCHTPVDKQADLRILPYAPATETVRYEDLSPYSKAALASVMKNPKTYKSRKLMTTFRPKRGYLTYYMNYQAMVDAGVKIDKINYIYRFKQERHMLPFVEICNELRRAATTVVEGNLWKGVPNFSYGFTLYNPMKNIEATFVKSRKKAARLLNSSRFVSCRILDENLIVVYTRQKRIVHRSPIMIGEPHR